MHAMPVMIVILCAMAIAYRYYSAFLAAKVATLDDRRITPAVRLNDGQNYHPTNKWVLFGHHFAAIAGAGPLIGPVLAAQFGYAPGLIWLVGGVCLAGAVQDFIVLWASTRRGGRSLADIARTEVGPVAGITSVVAILFILIIAMAGLGLVVVNALAESAWGTFTIFVTIPLAIIMGFYMFKWRSGHIREATIVGVTIIEPALGDIDIKEGTFGIQTTTTQVGNSARTITVYSNAVLNLFRLTNSPLNKIIVLSKATEQNFSRRKPSTTKFRASRDMAQFGIGQSFPRLGFVRKVCFQLLRRDQQLSLSTMRT